MTRAAIWCATVLVWSATLSPAAAQTADEVIARSIKALGGEAALAKITSRRATGTVVISTPAGDITGEIEALAAAPNQARTLIKADLTALGAGQLVLDQRFNGETGYILDTLQGNREMTGDQLDAQKTNFFPHPFLNYKGRKITATLSGKEKVGDREAYVIVFDPPQGRDVRYFIDAETYLPIQMVITVMVPQIGQDVEQTTRFVDHRAVDGVQIPFRLETSSSVQRLTVTLKEVEHNVDVDETLFSKPGAQ